MKLLFFVLYFNVVIVVSGFSQEIVEPNNVVAVTGDISENSSWVSNYVYQIKNPVKILSGVQLRIFGGAIVEFSDPNSMLIVRENGILISGIGRGKVIFRPVGELNFEKYRSAILIEKNASPNTEIKNSVFMGAEKAIISKSKIRAFRNNTFFACAIGLTEFGPFFSDVINNTFALNLGGGLHIVSDNSLDPNFLDSNGEIEISGNLFDSNKEVGIFIDGTDANDIAPFVYIHNNVFINSLIAKASYGNYYGYITNNGYYAISLSLNFPEIQEFNSIFEDEYPYFVDLSKKYPEFFLLRNSNFVNSGDALVSEYPEFLGSNSEWGRIDSGMLDLGVHHNSLELSLTGKECDFNSNGVVDLFDLKIFSENFLNRDPNSFDLNSDGILNLQDFNVFRKFWLKDFNSVLKINLPSDVVQGYFNLQISDCPENVRKIAVYLDENFLGLLNGDSLDYSEEFSFSVLSNKYRNGLHEILVKAYDNKGNLLSFGKKRVMFSNIVYNLSERFDGDGIFISGKCAQEMKLVVRNFVDDNIISLKQYKKGGFNFHIGPEILKSSIVYDVSFSGVSVLNNNLGALTIPPKTFKEFKKKFVKKYDPKKYLRNSPVEFVVFLPNPQLTDYRYDFLRVLLGLLEKAKIDYVILYGSDCNYSNLEHVMIVPRNVKYFYCLAHGNSEVGNVQRTFFVDGNGKPVFSYLNDPGHHLPDDLDKKAFDITKRCKLVNLGRLKFVFVDSCKSGKFRDLAVAFGMNSESNKTYWDQGFIGWKDESFASKWIGNYNNFLIDFFTKMIREKRSLKDSFDYASLHRTGSLKVAENVVFCGIDPQRVYIH